MISPAALEAALAVAAQAGAGEATTAAAESPGWPTAVAWGLICLGVPVIWGVAVNYMFERFTTQQGASRRSAPPEYQI